MKKILSLLCCFFAFITLSTEELPDVPLSFSVLKNGSLAKQNTEWGNLYVFYDKNGLYCTLEKFEDLVIQKKYTDSLQLAEEHRYKTAEQENIPFYLEAYSYKDDLLQRKITLDNDSKIIKEDIYADSGKLIQNTIYTLENKLTPTEFSTVDFNTFALQSQTNWKYENDFLQEITEKNQDFSYKTVFEKNAFNLINEFNYKNDDLYQKKVFLSDSTYEVSVYFSKDYWVVSLYENDLKKSDAYYLNGTLIRKKEFEVTQ